VTQIDPSKTIAPRVPGLKHGTFYGAVLLILLAAFWAESFTRFQIVAWRQMSFWAWSFLGLDFAHNYMGVNTWLRGVDPYLNDIGDPRGHYSYPPIVLPMFVWCKFFSFKVATAIWTACVAATLAWGAWFSHQVRRANGLPFLAPVLAIALLLWSMPAIFAMERGNGDVLVLLAMIGAILAWRGKPSILNDAIIAFCFAFAAWVKVYPLVLFGLLVLTGRWRALILGFIFLAAIGLVPYKATQGFFIASKTAQGARTDSIGAATDWLAGRPMRKIRRDYAPIEFSSHSLTSYWPSLWSDLRVQPLTKIPGLIGAAVCLFPLGAWVMWAFWRSRHRERWVWPVMLWVTALATFWMPVSYDYNLFYLPLAMFAVWDHRDGVVTNLALASAIFWWQPLRPPDPVTPELLFFVKLASLILVAQALVRRLRGPQAQVRVPETDEGAPSRAGSAAALPAPARTA
jgi:hypothetical protein